MNISLSRDSGKKFLEKVKTINLNLKQHIDTFRDFINLVYAFREKVIHQEGLHQFHSPVVPSIPRCSHTRLRWIKCLNITFYASNA